MAITVHTFRITTKAPLGGSHGVSARGWIAAPSSTITAGGVSAGSGTRGALSSAMTTDAHGADAFALAGSGAG